MKKFRTITLAVALTTALSMGAAGVQATHMDTGNAVGTGSPIGTLGTGATGTTTSTGYTGSNYDATSPGVGLGTGVSNFSGNGTNGVYNGNLTTPNTYSGYGTAGRGTGVMDHMNGYGTNPVEKGANAVERGVERGANAIERGVDRSANMVDRMSTKSLATATPSTNGNSYRAYATTDNDNDMDWGWLGLVGLLGLAGLRSNNRRKDESYK